MSQKPTIPSQYLPDPCGATPYIAIVTDEPGFLYMLFSTIKPTKKPRYKEIRGVPVECGFEWQFHYPLCIPQTNPSASNLHQFALPTMTLGECAWYIISTSCNRANATSFTPPIQYCYEACPPSGAFIRMQRTPTTLNGGSYSLAFRDVVAGNAAARVNDLTIEALSTGGYSIQAKAKVRADPFGPSAWTGHTKFEKNGTNVIATGPTFTSQLGEELTIELQASVNLQANDLITFGVERTSATGLLQTPSSIGLENIFSLTPL